MGRKYSRNWDHPVGRDELGRRMGKIEEGRRGKGRNENRREEKGKMERAEEERNSSFITKIS